MKRFFLYFTLITCMFATSCNLFSEEEESDYKKVYGGLVMYFSVEQTNTHALDGVNVAMRLALLLNEMEAAGVAFDGDDVPDWSALGDVRYGGLNYNKRYFLFGNDSGSAISKKGDDYSVKYGNSDGLHSAGVGDMCYRSGDFKISTSGNSNLLNSTEDKPWKITIDCDSISYSNLKSSTVSSYESKKADAKLWYVGDGEFGYSVSDAKIKYVDNEDYSDWSMSGTFSIDNFSALTIEDTMSTDFLMSSKADGTAISSGEYTYETLSPVVYNFLSGANLKYGGAEKVVYNTGLSVNVDTASDGIQTIYFNGSSYAYDDEYYYYFYYENYNTIVGEDDDDE